MGDAVPGTSSFLGDFFGEHVASNSKWLMVGAPRESVDLDENGLNGAQGDIDVGAGIALQGNVMMVGAANDDNFPGLKDRHRMLPNLPFAFAGHVYVYNYDSGSDQWLLVQKLSSDGPHTGAFFGGHPHLLHKRCACPDAGAFLSNAAQ